MHISCTVTDCKHNIICFNHIFTAVTFNNRTAYFTVVGFYIDKFIGKSDFTAEFTNFTSD